MICALAVCANFELLQAYTMIETYKLNIVHRKYTLYPTIYYTLIQIFTKIKAKNIILLI